MSPSSSKKNWAKAGSRKRVQIGGWQDTTEMGREFWVERGSNPSPKGGRKYRQRCRRVKMMM